MNRLDLCDETLRCSHDEADKALLGVRAALARRRRRRRARRAIILLASIAGALMILATTTVIVALLLAREAPTWWRTVDPADPTVIELAERVERAVVSAMHKVRPAGEPWSVAVTASQANAWLNVKLPRWVRSRQALWPPEVAEVQTHFGDGRFSVGVRIRDADQSQIIAATMNPRLVEDGSLWLTQPSTNAGRLDLPAGWTIARLAEWFPAELKNHETTRLALEALRQRGPALPTTWVSLEDGRQVRLVSLRIEHDRLVLTCATDRAPIPDGAPAPSRPGEDVAQ